MPEINLPTSIKQDSIKQTVEDIASNFPLDISGGVNWDEKTPCYVSAFTASQSLTDVLEISGSGYITSIFQSASINNTVGYLKIVVDDVVVLNDSPISKTSQPGFFSPLIRFNHSLKIQHHRSSGNDITTNIFYLLD